jgi:dihydroorotase
VKQLCTNHKRWQTIDNSYYQDQLKIFTPSILDHSMEVESRSQNVENEQLFLCYYPDGAVKNCQGGFNDPNDFKEFIDNMQQAGFNINLKIDVAKQFVNGSDGDQLICSCLV